MITKEREDYLKTIYHLQRHESPVRTTTIAKTMGVEPASVTGAIKRLAELDYLDYERYRGVTLTESGRRVALEVIRHHRLIELYLIEALDYTWDEVHDEAERLEHAVSPLFIERIEKALGHPDIDPHGSPIPTSDGHIPLRNERALSSLTIGDEGMVSRVDDKDPELLRYLTRLGINIGVGLQVKAITPYGGSLAVVIDGNELSLGSQAADKVFITLKES